MRRALLAIAAAVMLTSCDLPTESRTPDLSRPCATAADGCDGVLRPLSVIEVEQRTTVAREFVMARHPAQIDWGWVPVVEWSACWFRTPGGICAAGYCDVRGRRIYISTMEVSRTGPLVTHEMTHWYYWRATGDVDAGHRNPYP